MLLSRRRSPAVEALGLKVQGQAGLGLGFSLGLIGFRV